MCQPGLNRQGFILFAVLFVTACGGGGGSSDGSTPSDTTAPDTTLTSMPALYSNTNNPLFGFSSSETNSTFAISLDGGSYVAASSPHQFSGLADGVHTLLVRAIDAAGNVDSSPASYTWTVDTIPPSAGIIFPSAVSLTDANSIIIRGTASDQNAISSISVNGTTATTRDGYHNWQATIPVSNGINQVSVSVTDVAGNTDSGAASCSVTSKGTILQQIYASKVNGAGSLIYAYDEGLHALVVINTATGIRSILSDKNHGSGQAIGLISDFYLDEANNRLIAVDWSSDLLLAINTASGNRSILSNVGTTSDTQFQITAGLTYDLVNNRVFVVDRGKDSIIEINLSNGQRTLLSNATTGTGPTLSNPLGIVYDAQTDAVNPRLFVVDSGLRAVVSIDVKTGNRALYSSASPIGTGAALSVPVFIHLDYSNNRLLVVDADASINKLIAIDLTSGNRTNVVSTAGYDVFPFGYSFNAANTDLYMTTTSGADIISLAIATSIMTDISSIAIGNGPQFKDVRSISLDSNANRLIVPDGYTDAIYSVSLETGDRQIVSGMTKGTGVNFGLLISAVLDVDTNPAAPRALVVDADLDALFAVDLATGNRTIISNAATGTGDNMVQARDLVHDIANNRVLVADSYVVGGVITGVLRAIDLSNGNRTIISDSATGTGIKFVLLNSVSLDKVTDPLNPRALITDGQTFGVVDVDLTNGNRNMLSSNPPTGFGIPFYLPTDSVLDETNHRLLVTDFSQKSLIAVDLTTGNRSLISGREAATESILGNGPLGTGIYLEADLTRNLAYQSDGEAIIMIDLMTGERVIITW